MAISYNKLWKLLIDRKMSKADLRRAAGIAPNTMTKLNRDEEVTLETLGKICAVLVSILGILSIYFPRYKYIYRIGDFLRCLIWIKK